MNFIVTIKILRPPMGSCSFVVFEKFTCANLHKIAPDIMLLPLLTLCQLYLLVLTLNLIFRKIVSSPTLRIGV